jgi:hypothetical protein
MEVWYGVSDSEIEELELLDRVLLRHILGQPRSTPTEFLDAKHLYEALMSFCLSVCLSVFLSVCLSVSIFGSQEEFEGVWRSQEELRRVKRSQDESR